MKHTWKKTTAFIMAMALVAGFAPAKIGGFMPGGTAITASAAATDPTDPEKFIYDGVTYYNVHADDAAFNNSLELYKQLLFTKSDELGGYSIAQLWAIMAAGTDYYTNIDEQVRIVKDNIDNHPDRGTECYVDNGTTLNFRVWQQPHWEYQIRFQNFKLIPMLPDSGKEGNYVTTTYSKDDSSNKSVIMSGITNDTSQSQSKTIRKTDIKSFSVSSATEKKVNAEIGATVEIGTTAKAAIVEATEKATFSMKVATEAMWSNSKQESDTKDESQDITLTAPPYTAFLMSDEVSKVTAETKYNCPLALSYDVILFRGDHGYFTKYNLSFGTDGIDARQELIKRVAAANMEGADRQGITWKKSKILENPTVKFAYNKLAANIPMTTIGTTFTETRETKLTTFCDYEPLYPLSYIKPDVTAISMKKGDNKYTDSFGLKGYNTKNADYYGFDQRNGYWIATDKSGNALTPENSPIKLTEATVTIDGKKQKVYVAANEMLGGAKITAVKPGACQLRYMIDEGRYTSVETQNMYSTNKSIGDKTAIIDVTVAGDEIAFNENIKIKPINAFTGHVGKEPVCLDDYFDVEFKDNRGKDIDYIWESKQTKKKGIAFNDDNEVYFTKPGTFEIRVVDPKDEDNFSDSIEITAEVYGDDWEAPDEPVEYVDADADTTFVISGSYTGLVGAEPDAIEGEPSASIKEDEDGTKYFSHGRLQVDALDKTDKEINVAYTWEAMETEGINITEDGKVSFTLPGIYHVRTKSGEYASNWFIINAKNSSEEYSTISFLNPDGIMIENITQPWGSVITAPDDPEMEGYIFKGWSADIPETMPSENMELTAQWEIDDSAERVLIKGNVRGAGQLAVSENGEEPVFDEQYPTTSLYNNTVKGESLIFSAKPDDGWKFIEWQDRATGEVYSKDATITIAADTPLDLIAVFDTEDAVTEHKLTDAQLMQWSQKNYRDKTGVDANVEITGWSDDEYEISITDNDDKVLDTYKVNPDTGIGTNQAGEEVNLPKTGMSGAHKAFAGLAALMGIAGFGLVKKSKKKNED